MKKSITKDAYVSYIGLQHAGCSLFSVAVGFIVAVGFLKLLWDFKVAVESFLELLWDF